MDQGNHDHEQYRSFTKSIIKYGHSAKDAATTCYKQCERAAVAACAAITGRWQRTWVGRHWRVVKREDRLTVVFTFVIAFATCVYVIVAMAQWSAMQSTIGEYRREFEFEKRPVVILSQVELVPPAPPVEDESITFEIHLANIGGGAALEVEARLRCAIGPMREPHDRSLPDYVFNDPTASAPNIGPIPLIAAGKEWSGKVTCQYGFPAPFAPLVENHVFYVAGSIGYLGRLLHQDVRLACMVYEAGTFRSCGYEANRAVNYNEQG